MRRSSRYFATVRRVTWMPASSSFLAIRSSVSGCAVSSSSIIFFTSRFRVCSDMLLPSGPLTDSEKNERNSRTPCGVCAYLLETARLTVEGCTPQELVRDAVQQGARVLVSTYNEPLITSEWAVAVFKEAKAAGLATGYVSNGNGTPQVLEYLRPWVDLYKVNLKSFDDRHYRQLGGRMEPILQTIRCLHEMGLWVEIVTLLIPGFNDSDDELKRLTEFVAGVSPTFPGTLRHSTRITR